MCSPIEDPARRNRVGSDVRFSMTFSFVINATSNGQIAFPLVRIRDETQIAPCLLPVCLGSVRKQQSEGRIMTQQMACHAADKELPKPPVAISAQDQRVAVGGRHGFGKSLADHAPPSIHDMLSRFQSVQR